MRLLQRLAVVMAVISHAAGELGPCAALLPPAAQAPAVVVPLAWMLSAGGN